MKIQISEKIGEISAILNKPRGSKYFLILAHGAGAGMTHTFMESLAEELAKQKIATLRFNFSYIEKGSKRPDSPNVAHTVIRAVIEVAKKEAKALPIYASGKSFGGRMFSQLLSKEIHPEIKGLIFYGFPLHAPGRDGIERAEHLKTVKQQMLFLQGTRDTLAKVELIEEVCEGLKKAKLAFIENGDHSFKVLKRSGIDQETIIPDLAARTAKFMK